MSVPPFEDFFNPVLNFLYEAKGSPLSQSDLVAKISQFFSLTEEDLAIRTKSGKDTKVYNRVIWARTYLKNAGFAYSPKKGFSEITKEGIAAIESGIKLTSSYLKKLIYDNKSETSYALTSPIETQEESYVPEEEIIRCKELITESLCDDLLSEIMSQSPSFFESLVVDLLASIYGGEFENNSEVLGKTGDRGVDGIIKQDRLGFDNIYIQAKRWQDPVGRQEIQKFSGALDGVHCTRGAYITTSSYSSNAIEYANGLQNKKIVLINGKQLTKLMIEYGIGVEDKMVVVIKKVDWDYFHPDQ